MFAKKNMKKQRIQDINRAIQELERAGYKNVDHYASQLMDYYETQKLVVLEPELRISILMMAWLVLRTGTNNEISDLYLLKGSMFAKPMNSIYFYWIPSQLVRCRQLGGEIRCRCKDRVGAYSPEPSLPQNVLEEKYESTRDTVYAMLNIVPIPEELEESFTKFTHTTDKMFAPQQTNRRLAKAQSFEYGTSEFTSQLYGGKDYGRSY